MSIRDVVVHRHRTFDTVVGSIREYSGSLQLGVVRRLTDSGECDPSGKRVEERKGSWCFRRKARGVG